MRKKTRQLGFAFGLAATAALLLSIGAGAHPPSTPKIGMVCASGGPSFDLYTTSGTIQTPDGNTVFMWGYSNDSHFQNPGPVLCVEQGQTVSVTLHNTFSEPVSIVFPGQQDVTTTAGNPGVSGPDSLTKEAAPGGTVTYTFPASKPGTYLYESGSDPSKQVEMGLVGALVVRPTLGDNYAYNSVPTRFDPNREYLLLLSEIDPDLHAAVETGGPYDFSKLHNHYYSINGRQFPDTIQDNGSALLPGQPYGALVRLQPTGEGNESQNALIRMINAGALNHPFHPHGNHTKEIAQDGNLETATSEHFGETIGSGQTKDYLMRWDNHPAAFNDDWNPNANPLPVAQPNYRNLTFKDALTWYAGSPYLGYKGTLPTGTSSLNICGEWYFPFHSHALDEFSNFDEGFGGMGTLLRVDPKGGCFAFPAAAKITVKSLSSGTVAYMAADETQNIPPGAAKYYSVKSSTSSPRTTDWYAQFSGLPYPPNGATNLVASYQGKNSISGLTTDMYAWKWTAPTGWVQIGAFGTTIGTSDATVSAPVAPAADFVGTGSYKGQVRVRVVTTGNGTNFVTSANLFKLVYDAT